ncbi:MAG: hypothetical protein M3395_08220 [Chloroflexota bacterium]|nr:hypothetical protein [Chloroflexota bacterium]
MTEDLEIILARVAAGEITAEEAEPLVAAAVDGTSYPVDGAPGPAAGAPAPAEGSAPAAALDPGTRPRRNVRLRVTERGRAMVDLRIPIGLAELAGAVVPGLSGPQAERIREALRTGRVGPVLEVLDKHGDGVVISTE